MKTLRFSIGQIMEQAAENVDIAGWKGCAWECCDGIAGIVTGHVYTGEVFKSGQRKGKLKPKGVPGTKRIVGVTNEQMQARAARYEATGACWNCQGSGRRFASWSRDKGTETAPCERCGATGRI